ncbi:MAG: Bax inhibitor-1/YccA family protein [Rhodospirillales bacterium]|nr:Bax inhibitor-1/YccA family protein [Rhodospirillales bacterium]
MAADRRFQMRADSLSRAGAEAAQIDVGLRQYMLRVYNYMALGVAGTGIIAMLVSQNPAIMQAVALGPMKWVLFIGILGLGFFAPKIMMSRSIGAAQACFWVYAAMWGALIAPMFYMYTQGSIARAFFVTAAAFAAMSLYGYTTKRDLSAIGRFLVMATFGVLIALVVNIFLQSSGLQLLMSFLVPVIFAGLTAFETQQIKSWYYESDAGDVTQRKAIFGAFMLYGSFVTMFIWILQLVGVARSE